MMKCRLIAALAALALLVGLIAVPAFTDEEASDEAAAMEWWMKMGTPGEHHAWLGFLAGSWTAESRFGMGPGEPHVSTGKLETRWILDRRYVRYDYTGAMQGVAFVGEGTLGYNNATGEYESTWMDSMSTSIMMSRGKREGNAITLRSEAPTPMGRLPTRDVLTKVGDDEYTVESFWTMPDVGEVRVSELRFHRAE